jgi:hypothetical protein
MLFTLGVFTLGALGGYLGTCLVSSAQANRKVIRPLAALGIVWVLVGSWWIVPPILKEIANEGSTHFERKSVPQKE